MPVLMNSNITEKIELLLLDSALVKTELIILSLLLDTTLLIVKNLIGLPKLLWDLDGETTDTYGLKTAKIKVFVELIKKLPSLLMNDYFEKND